MNRRRMVRSLVGAALILVGAACGGSTEEARHDPLQSEGPPPDAVILYTAAVEGLLAVDEGGPPPLFGLMLAPSCLVAVVDTAFSTCMGTEPGSQGAVHDGGIHGDASAGWVVTGDEQVVSARFWMIDGTTFDQQALLANDRPDPPIVFGHAVAATNEIVGIELLDAEGHVVMALSVDPEA